VRLQNPQRELEASNQRHGSSISSKELIFQGQDGTQFIKSKSQ